MTEEPRSVLDLVVEIIAREAKKDRAVRGGDLEFPSLEEMLTSLYVQYISVGKDHPQTPHPIASGSITIGAGAGGVRGHVPA
jgi:hypothetical protein